MEADWLDRFAQVLGSQGRWARRVLSAPSRAPGDPEQVLGQELVLDNATFRLLDMSPAWTRYLVLDFRVSAVSDDKRDFTLRLGINLATGALPDAVLAALAPALNAPAHDGPVLDGSEADPVRPDDIGLPAPWERARLLGLVARALPPRVETDLVPFVKGLRRRLARDGDRLHAYHNDLHHEAMRRALTLPEGDPRRQREEQRAEAIGREYRAKLDDLSRQYATRVTVEWVQTLELVMPVQRFTVQIRRRKAERTIRLDWNGRWQGFRPRVHTAAAAPWRDDSTSGGNSNGSPAPGASAYAGAEREEVPYEASARRFVPEAMRSGDTGTLIAQQGCGTIQGRRTAPSHPAPQPCCKGWFVGRLRRTPETAAALGSPSYKQPPVTATPV